MYPYRSELRLGMFPWSVLSGIGLRRRRGAAALFPMRGDFLASKTSADGTSRPTDRERLEEESLKVEGKCHVNALICVGEECHVWWDKYAWVGLLISSQGIWHSSIFGVQSTIQLQKQFWSAIHLAIQSIFWNGDCCTPTSTPIQGLNSLHFKEHTFFQFQI